MSQQVVDFIEEVVDAINLTQVVTAHVDDGTDTTVTVGNLYHAREDLLIDIDGTDYTILSVNQSTNQITVSGVIADPLQTILSTPIYRHGTPRAASNEINLIAGNSINREPFIYLFERIVEDFDTDLESVVQKDVEITIVFLDEYDAANWITDDHYTNVIIPQRRLMDVFIATLKESPKVGLINSWRVINEVKFGVETTNKGSEDSIFDTLVSGPQLVISYQSFHTDDLCDTPVTCRPAVITDGGTVLVPSGASYTCTGGGDSIRVSNSDDTYDVTTAIDLELPDITHTDSDLSPVVLPAQTPMICTPPAAIRVSNSNDSYDVNTSVDLELPNIDVTDCDGSTTSVPSMEDIVCTPNNIRVSNSNDSYDVNSTVDLELPNINFTQTDGAPVSVPSMEDLVCNPSAKDIDLRFNFDAADDTTDLFTITAFEAGTYTSISDDGGSGTITIDINGGGFGAFVNPTVLVATDTVQFFRTTDTAAGFVQITGTYV